MMALVPTGGGASFDNVCKALFGDVFDVDVAKGAPDQADVNGGGSTRRKIEQGSNAIGMTAGALGLSAAAKDPRLTHRGGKETRWGRAMSKVPAPVARFTDDVARRPKLARAAAGVALGTQVVNLAGDGLIAGTLASTGKKKQPVDKADARANPLDTQAAQAGQDIKRFVKTPAGKVSVGALGAYGLVKTGQRRSQSQGQLVDPYVYGKADTDSVFAGEFSKFDDDKRLAFGWASVVELDGMPVVDKQGDYISIDDLEDAAYTYVHKSRVGGDMHKRDGESPHHVSDMVESIVFTDDKIAKMGLPDNFPRGWWVGFKVHDADTWDLVRKQGRTGFSIHGKGVRKDVPLDDLMGY